MKSSEDIINSKMKIAIENGDTDLARKLLTKGADPNVIEMETKKNSQHSILILSISLKETNIARLLVENGAEVDTIYMNYDDDNLCIYEMTAWTTAKLMYDEEPTPSMGELLYVIEERLKSYKGRTPKKIPPKNLPLDVPSQVLLDAIRESDEESVRLLISHGVDVNTVERDSKSGRQHSVLITAITLEQTQIAKLLIENGAEVDTVFQNYDPTENVSYDVTALEAAQTMHQAFPDIGMEKIIEIIKGHIKGKKGKPKIIIAYNTPLTLRHRGSNVIQPIELPIPTIRFENVDDPEDVVELEDTGTSKHNNIDTSCTNKKRDETISTFSRTCTVL
ncbi:uncharacterized protein LOC102808875 [Saccoglossus kowalevskii]|uniref:Uncharacterized protein LOC102808875 n=1 Tax=Saccoglossus kowalevskii TaxID=10224 RepID=A0ABM0MHD2_SACKO|nr:PREDICTED: uncharacterized protein LOC102808875 [Saccoglossus kowalevskii]